MGIKLLIWGVAALLAGAVLLLGPLPGIGVWRGLAIAGIGLILICMGAREVYHSQEPPEYGSREAPTAVTGPSGDSPEQAPAARSTSFTPLERTFLVVLGVFVSTGIGLFLHVATKHQEQADASPERVVLEPLSIRAGTAEQFLMGMLDVPEDEQRFVADVRRLLQAKDYDAVIARLAEEGNQSHYPGRLLYAGMALYHKNRHREAVDLLSRFIEFQEEQDAFSIYRRASRCYRAKARLALGRTEEALADVSRAIRIAPAAELHVLRAEIYEEFGKSKLAADDMRKAKELDPFLKLLESVRE